MARRGWLAALLAGALLAAACSPEAMRSRNGGPGGDIGNRSGSVDLHGTSNPYYRTPSVGTAAAK